jgi:hypothetical protein
MTRFNRMVQLVFVLALSTIAPIVAQQPQPPAVVGRWDVTVLGPTGRFPSWFEVNWSGNRTLVGRYVGRVGSSRPVAKYEFANNVLRFTVPPQWETGDNDVRFEGTLEGDRLSGWMTDPAGTRYSWSASRAPLLRRATTPTWSTPIRLLDANLSAWLPEGENNWRMVNGVLTNTKAGGNLITRRAFDDFKLHVEFRYPRGGNSGVYLRGRHEVQIEDNGNQEPLPVHNGGIYGFIAPSLNASRNPGEWQTFDITLIGRLVTVVLNGKAIIQNQVIPGITGGALDSNEGAPGPIMLQGDHGPIEFRNIILTPAVVGRR